MMLWLPITLLHKIYHVKYLFLNYKMLGNQIYTQILWNNIFMMFWLPIILPK